MIGLTQKGVIHPNFFFLGLDVACYDVGRALVGCFFGKLSNGSLLFDKSLQALNHAFYTATTIKHAFVFFDARTLGKIAICV